MKKKKILIISLITFILLSVIAISLMIFLPRRYRIPKSALDIFDYTAEDGVRKFTQSAMYYDYTDVYADKDGNLVFVMTREEQKKFLEMLEDGLSFYETYYVEDGFYVEYNNNYTEVSVKCTKEKYNEYGELLMKQIMYEASWCQAFMGVKPEDNRVRLQVIDIDTGEVLYERTVEKAD